MDQQSVQTELKYDLHTHTTASDGVLSPGALVERAQAQELQLLAITDHDTVAGVRQVVGDQQGLKVIAGAELTCLWGRRMVHIVGLGLDCESLQLDQYLTGLDQLRQQRAEKVAQRLLKKGLPDLLPDAQALAAGGVIGRPHFAAAMVARGLVSTEQQAFSAYLGAGKAGDVKMQWPSLADAVQVIQAAGGIPVFAHPTKYKFTFTKIRELISDFKASGGEAIEVSYTGISPSHQHELVKLALSNELLVSAGSDFHNPAHHWTEVGRFMPLRQVVPHVIDRLV